MSINHENLLSRIIQAFGKVPQENNPELASAINEAKSTIEKQSINTPGQEKRDIPEDVSRINLRGGAIRLVVKQGNVPSLLLESHRQSHLDYVLTEIAGDTLTIGCKPMTFVSGQGRSFSQIDDNFGNIRIQQFSGYVVNTGVLSFTSNIDGNGNVESVVTGLDNPIIESDSPYLASITITLPNVTAINVSGSGEVEYQKFTLHNFSTKISGSANITLTGAVSMLDAEISGSGCIKASKLTAKNARIRVSGSGSIKSNVIEKLNARISGSGSVKITGNPPIRDTKVSGSGEVKFR